MMEFVILASAFESKNEDKTEWNDSVGWKKENKNEENSFANWSILHGWQWGAPNTQFWFPPFSSTKAHRQSMCQTINSPYSAKTPNENDINVFVYCCGNAKTWFVQHTFFSRPMKLSCENCEIRLFRNWHEENFLLYNHHHCVKSHKLNDS